MLHHIKLSGSLLGDDLVGDFFQFRVELLEQIFKQKRQELERTERVRERERPSSVRQLLTDMIHLSSENFRVRVVTQSDSQMLWHPTPAPAFNQR